MIARRPVFRPQQQDFSSLRKASGDHRIISDRPRAAAEHDQPRDLSFRPRCGVTWTGSKLRACAVGVLDAIQ